jgi:glycine cleavage system H protein
MEVRKGLLYTESHEWVKADGDVATIGISDYAQAQLKDVVYVDLPDVGSAFKKGDALGVLESVKTVADIYSPVSGNVSEVNRGLKDHPEWINQDPFGEGWLIRITMGNRDELSGLISAEDYQKSLPEEE